MQGGIRDSRTVWAGLDCKEQCATGLLKPGADAYRLEPFISMPCGPEATEEGIPLQTQRVYVTF